MSAGGFRDIRLDPRRILAEQLGAISGLVQFG
jgi:hypothetical protein